MLLRRFSVEGFKNFRSKVTLDGLRPLNVIHGPNNVGKSNLFQAMALFFRCLDPGESSFLPFKEFAPLPAGVLADVHLVAREAFSLQEPKPIVLAADITLSEDELVRGGIAELYPSRELTIAVELAWDGRDKVSYRLPSFVFADGTNAADRASSAEEKTRVLRFAKFIAKSLVRDGPDRRFALVGVQRDLELDTITHPRGLIPLALEMFELRESMETARRDRWHAFQRAMTVLTPLMGVGTFDVTFQRSEGTNGTARLVFDAPNLRIPLRLLGTGVQQVAALFAHVLLRNASVVAIEEPELNLRWDLQLKVCEGLSQLLDPAGRGGPSQLFVSSHSPAFESGDDFFLMRPDGDRGPRVERVPASEAGRLLGLYAADQMLPQDASQAYVSTQGVVRLPEFIRRHMQLVEGGGVVFRPGEDGEAVLLSDARFLELLGASEE